MNDELLGALRARSERGTHRDVDTVWDAALDDADTARVDASQLQQIADAPDDERHLDGSSRAAWSLAVAAALLVVVVGLGFALINIGDGDSSAVAAGDSEPNQPLPSENDDGTGDDDPGTTDSDNSAATTIPPFTPLALDPEGTLISETTIDDIEFRIIHSPGAADQVDELADLPPTTLQCAEDAQDEQFPDSCLAIARDIISDDTDTFRFGSADDVRYVERAQGDVVETTATFLANDDVFRIVGACETQCVRDATDQLSRSRALAPTDAQPQAGEGWEFLAWAPIAEGDAFLGFLESQAELDSVVEALPPTLASPSELAIVAQTRTPALSVDFETEIVIVLSASVGSANDCLRPLYREILFTDRQILVDSFDDPLDSSCDTSPRPSISLFALDRDLLPDDDPENISVSLGQDLQQYLGLTLEEATELATQNGLTVRLTSIDGEPQPVTLDRRPDRLNFEIVDDRVVAVFQF